MIGTDIIEIARVEAAWKRRGDAFLHKVFTPSEIAHCMKQKRPGAAFAARFCAKEAIVKALGTGFREGIGFHDIEITNDSLGKPTARLSGRFASHNVQISMSHCKEYATAVALTC